MTTLAAGTLLLFLGAAASTVFQVETNAFGKDVGKAIGKALGKVGMEAAPEAQHQKVSC
jgi:hypothetical protein